MYFCIILGEMPYCACAAISELKQVTVLITYSFFNFQVPHVAAGGKYTLIHYYFDKLCAIQLMQH